MALHTSYMSSGYFIFYFWEELISAYEDSLFIE